MTFLGQKLLTPQQVEESAGIFEKIQGYTLVSHGKSRVRFGKMPIDSFTTLSVRSQLVERLAALGQQATKASRLYKTYIEHIEEKNRRASGSKIATATTRSPELAIDLVTAVGLSSRAYSLLGIDGMPGGVAFRDGFGKRFAKLFESEPKEESRYGAVLVLAANEEKLLKTVQEEIDDLFKGLGKIIWEEGSIEKGTDGSVRDHFGFREGMSQPVFFDTPDRRTASWTSTWDPAAALGYVLAREPSASADDEYGSLMAYLKIAQDKAAFDKVVQSMVTATQSCPADVKAWMLGRKADGEPLVARGATSNDFDFESDPSFAACPVAAHIRKVNPRTDAGRNHRIVRRSAFYEYAENDCGALFQCFQSKLETGFEFIFRDWALAEDHPEKESGPDVMLGFRNQPPKPANVSVVPGTAAIFDVRSFTTIKEGEYFYFPSIPFFERLSQANTALS